MSDKPEPAYNFAYIADRDEDDSQEDGISGSDSEDDSAAEYRSLTTADSDAAFSPGLGTDDGNYLAVELPDGSDNEDLEDIVNSLPNDFVERLQSFSTSILLVMHMAPVVYLVYCSV